MDLQVNPAGFKGLIQLDLRLIRMDLGVNPAGFKVNHMRQSQFCMSD